MSIEDLPLVNAAINTTVALLLLRGVWLVKHGRREAHKRAMLAAVGLSAVFLASYVTYHLGHGATKFGGTGLVRPVYFAILITHTVLAVVALPFVLLSVLRALRGDLSGHRRVARRTFAIWLYVAVTGPIVYLLLYQIYPSHAQG